MISEVANSLCLTYLASEYLIYSNEPHQSVTGALWKLRTFAVLGIIFVVNVFDHFTGAAAVVNHSLSGFFHLPRIFFAAWTYIFALFADCRRISPQLDFATEYMPQVGKAFLYVLPVYPFLAVLISVGFLFVVTILDALHLPEDWLNWPIYYGTMYGPFSFVYWEVKKKVSQAASSLPSFSGKGRAVGD